MENPSRLHHSIHRRLQVSLLFFGLFARLRDNLLLAALSALPVNEHQVAFSILLPFLQLLTSSSAPWTCTRCKNRESKKKIASAFSASQSSPIFPTSSYNSPYSPAHSDPKSMISEYSKDSPKIPGMVPGMQCEVAGCTSFLYALPSGSRPLCAKHRAEQRNASAKAAAPKPAPAPRPINKHKLHTVKPEDKHLLKRKRPDAKRSTGGSHQEMGREATNMFTFQPSAKSEFTFKAPESIRSLPSPKVLSPRAASKRTPERNRNLASAAKSPEEVEKAVDDLNRSLGSASMAESPIEPTPGWQGSLFSM
jgi:hypothetical protein